LSALPSATVSSASFFDKNIETPLLVFFPVL
jgi:hypothetical protein